MNIKQGTSCTIQQDDLFPILENIMKTTPTNEEVFNCIIDLLKSPPNNSPLFSAAQLKAGDIIRTQHPRYLPSKLGKRLDAPTIIAKNYEAI